MKYRILIFLLLALPGLAQVGPAPKANARLIEMTQVRIESLFQYHDKRPALPQESSNPFRPEDVLAGISGGPGGGLGTSSSISQNSNLLESAIDQINISGVVNMGDQMQIVANQLIYKEGSIILVHVGTETLFVRVMKITAKRVTFRLGEQELTVRF